MRNYIVSIWSKVDPKSGKYCKPFNIRTTQIKASSLANAGVMVFCGNTEFVGRISETGTDNTIA